MMHGRFLLQMLLLDALAGLVIAGVAANAGCVGTPSLTITGAPVNFWRVDAGAPTLSAPRQRLVAPGSIGCLEIAGFNYTGAAGAMRVQVLDATTGAVLGLSAPVSVAAWPTAEQNPIVVWQSATFAPFTPPGDVVLVFLPDTITSAVRFQVVADSVYPPSSGQDFGATIWADFALKVYPASGPVPSATPIVPSATLIVPSATPIVPTPASTVVLTATKLRATYATLPAGVTAEILADGAVAVSDVRALEQFCPAAAVGTACAEFTLVAVPGATKRIEMRAIDARGVRSALSRAVLVTIPASVPSPTRTATPLPSVTATRTTTPRPTASATSTATRTATPTATLTPMPTTVPPIPVDLKHVEILQQDGTVGVFSR